MKIELSKNNPSINIETIKENLLALKNQYLIYYNHDYSSIVSIIDTSETE